MCGRYASFRDAQDLADYFQLMGIDPDAAELGPSWNIAPTARVRVIATSDDGPRLRAATWGLVPSWAKDPSIGARMINARMETLADKPAFRRALAKRRCAVLADGYYEWKTGAGGKAPYFIARADGAPIAFAGLAEAWRGPDGWLATATIVTGPARGALADLHDREPVGLAGEALETWLDPDVDVQQALAALDRREGAEAMSFHPVAKAVGAVSNDAPWLIEPTGPAGDDA